MTILNALKEERLRIDNGRKWLYWESILKMWVVREHPYRAKSTKILIETNSEAVAVKVLLAEN